MGLSAMPGNNILVRWFVLGFFIAGTAWAQRKVPLEFDGGLGADPAGTQAKLTALTNRIPAALSIPPSFVPMLTGPDGAPVGAATVWLSPEVRAQYHRAADAGTAAMPWPSPSFCAQHATFVLPAPGSCAQDEAAVRAALSAATLAACLEVEEPERYMAASRAPATLAPNDSSGRVAFAESHTRNLEEQLAFAGAALGTMPVPQGLLPPDFVPALRRVLWKIRPAAATTGRLQAARTAYASALSTMMNAQPQCFDASLLTAVQTLDAELAALAAHVTQVLADGTAQAANERQCLGARSRSRPALPFPALTDAEREQVAFWLGGIYWRMRGGGVFQLGSTQNARTLFARRPFVELAKLAGGANTTAAERAADALYCALGDGWGDWMDMGTTPGGQDFHEDLVDMTERGRQHVMDFSTSALGLCLGQGVFNVNKSAEQYLREAGYDTQALFAGGISMGPCYAVAYNPMKAFTYFGANAPAPYSDLILGATSMGEFCVGASMGLGLVRSLLNGTPTGQAPVNLCAGRQCGTDACGTSCGTCSAGMSCDANGQCVMGGAGGGTGAGGSGGAGGGSGAGVGGGMSGSGGGGGSGGGDTGGAGGGSAGATGSGGSGGGSAGGSGGNTGGDAGGSATAGSGGSGTGGSNVGGGNEPPAQGCGCDSADGLFAFAALLFSRRARRRRS